MNRLWSYQNYVEHLSHANTFVRRWAFKAIENQFPRKFTKEVSILIGDPDERLACGAPKYLAKHRAVEYAPKILECFLESGSDVVSNNCAIALGNMNYASAFDNITEVLQNSKSLETFLGILHYLGKIRSDDSREVLLGVLHHMPDSDYVGSIAASLLSCRVPDDVSILLDILSDKHVSDFGTDGLFQNCMGAIESGGIYDDLTEYGRDNILDSPGKVLKNILGQYPMIKIEAELKNEITKRFENHQYLDIVTSLTFDARNIVRSRFPENNYPEYLSEIFHLDMMALSFLEGYSKRPSIWKSECDKDLIRNHIAAVISCYFSIIGRGGFIKAMNPQASIEELIDSLKFTGCEFPENIQDRLVELSPIDSLKNALTKELLTWGDIWTIRLMGKIGDEDFVPDLIRVVNNTESLAYIYSDAVTAIKGIEESAHETIFSAIRTGQLKNSYLIMDLLEYLPYSESFDIASKMWNSDDDSVDSYEFYAYCLAGIGDLRGIKALQEIFFEDNSIYIGDPLETLSCLYNEEIPELSAIRKKREDEKKRQKRRLKELNVLTKKAEPRGVFATNSKPSFATNSNPSKVTTFKRNTPKVGRNEPCPCGSGKKYKKCCLNKK